jgi:hypothetical protein
MTVPDNFHFFVRHLLPPPSDTYLQRPPSTSYSHFHFEHILEQSFTSIISALSSEHTEIGTDDLIVEPHQTFRHPDS